MRNQPSVSIVMPIYNAEPYLHQALDSVCSQTLSNIEIICVNDGSTDRSLEIIRRYAANDKRVTIIDKPNGGYGHSMNRGVKAATGEYVGILEPDDYLKPTMFERLYSRAKGMISISSGQTTTVFIPIKTVLTTLPKKRFAIRGPITTRL